MAATVTTDDEILQVWATFREITKDSPDYESLRNRLVERYMPLVRYNGERIWQRLPDGVDLDDLISAGIFGLMDAIDAFDLERGVKFETYCVPRIRGAILDELRTMDWVPRLVRSKASKLGVAHKELEAKFGRAPTDHELASHMEIDLRELEKMQRMPMPSASYRSTKSGTRPTAIKMFAKSTFLRTKRAKTQRVVFKRTT